MKPSELRILLAAAIRKREPILISGAPGIGKTDIATKAAADAGADLILSHPAVSDPTDVKGFPKLEGSSATFVPFGELAQAIKATRDTLWFLDDLGQASPAVQAAHMQLLLARRVNGHALPDCVTMIAATNRRTDRAGVSGVLEPVKSRFLTIVELVADMNEWCLWALDNSVAPEIIAYLRFHPDRLSAFAPSADLTNSPSPRTWAHASKLLSMDLPESMLPEVLSGAVGQSDATALLAFRRMYRELPSIDALLADPTRTAYPDNPGSLYALCAGLAYRATPGNFDRIGQFATRLAIDAHGEFSVLLVRDCWRRNPETQHTEASVRLQTGKVGQLMNGEAR